MELLALFVIPYLLAKWYLFSQPQHNRNPYTGEPE